MLTVWTMCTGSAYDPYYVQRLKREATKHLSIEHQFICITEHDIPQVPVTMKPPTDWPGWWGKLGLFKPGVASDWNLWLDLDVVVTGSLDELALRYRECELACPANWAQSGHGGCQSSVMVWNGKCHAPFEMFNAEDARWPPVNDGGLWGDQEMLTMLRDSGQINVTHTEPDLVRSYKYHCRGGLPENCRVVVFHGEPKPADVREPWFQW